MIRIRLTRSPMAAGAFFLSLIGPWFPIDAADHFITIGGGPTPFSNQVSLESNVRFSQRVIGKIRDDNPPQYVYFADGDIEKPDLQFINPDANPSPAIRWMTRLYGDEDTAKFAYRNHDIDNVTGPTRKSFVKQKFYELADKLKAGDRLFVYVTAHGGEASSGDYYDESYYDMSSSSDNEHNTTIALWNNDSLNVSEFDTWLNKFDRDVRVIMIMAQCHSGGFAHAIFHNADKRRGLNPQVRIGFFSQQHDRAAAGCTPEIDESSYQEYSTYFWEAVGGMTRAGDEIESPDFDGDGMVSFAEAHAHAIIASETIDIPITATDAFLRKYSRIAPMPDAEEEEKPQSFLGALFSGGKEDAKEDDTGDNESQPLARNQTLAQVTALARPEQQAILNRLAKELKIKSDDTVAKVRRKANKLEEAADAATQLWATSKMLIETERDLLAGSLTLQFPAIGNQTFSPKMAAFVSSEADQFVDFVQAQPQSDSYLKATKQATGKEAKMDRASNREAKTRRLLRTMENVLLEQNLSFHASAEKLAHFEQMMQLRQQGFTPQIDGE